MSGDSLLSAARAEVLRAAQFELAAAIRAAEPGQIAPLVRELRAVVGELDSLAGPAEASPLDEVKKRREARRAHPAGGGS
jgi:hypothetical protein